MADETPRTIVFVDGGVHDYQTLVSALPRDAVVVVLDPTRDGVAQIAQYMQSETNVGAIHIISDGASGLLQLGSTTLTGENLADHAADLASWSHGLVSGGDILLYGCQVAAGDEGHAFVDQVAQLTHADVAASTTVTGDTAAGGDWTFEYQSGDVQTGSILSDASGYDELLSHFRASSLTWQQTASTTDSARNIEFSMQTSFRASFFSSNLQIGQVVSVGTSFTFGDGQSTPIYLKVLSVDSQSDSFVGQWVTSTGGVVTHQYASDGNFTAGWESSARLSTTMNFANQGWRSETIVDVGTTNHSPVSSLPPIVQVADNATAHFTIPAVDADGDRLTFRLGNAHEFISSASSASTIVAPAGLSIDANTGEVTWDIHNSVVATNPGDLWVVTVMVEDHDAVTGAVKSKTPVDFLVKVVDAATNQPPVFDSVPGPQTLLTGQTLDLAVHAMDPNSNLSTVQILNPPAGMTGQFDSADGDMHIHFAPTVAGTYVVNFQATDSGGLTAQTSVTFVVNPSNTPPVVTTDAGATVAEGGHVVLGTLLLNTTDAQQSAAQLTYSLVDAPDHGQLTLNGAALAVGSTFTQADIDNGLVSFTHDGSETTSDAFTFHVSDGAGGATADTVFALSVTPVNDPPVVAGPISGVAVEAGPAVRLDALQGASDVDSPSLSATFTGPLPAGVTYDAASHSFTLDPSDPAYQALGAGQHTTVTVNYAVTDGQASTPQTMSWDVTGVNDAPTAASGVTAGSVTEIVDNAPGENVSLHQIQGQVGFADVDAGDVHSSSFTANGTGYLGTFSLGGVDETGHAVPWTFQVSDGALDTLSAGETRTQTYTVNVADNHGGTVAQTVTVTLQGTNDAPLIGTSAELVRDGGFESNPSGIWLNANNQGVEIGGQGTYGVTGASGNVMELDVNGAPNPIDDVSQTIATVAGQHYTFSFDAAARGGTTPADNSFDVLWNGVVIDRVTPGSTSMQHHSYTVVGAGGTGKLEFRELASGNNSLGGIIDNVSVQADAASGRVVEDATPGGVEQASNVLSFTDVDLLDTHSVSVAFKSTTGADGQLGAVSAAVTADTTHVGTGGAIAWTYAANDSALQHLAAGETVVETYTITLADGHGGLATRDVTVTVVGTNDAPVITSWAAAAQGSVQESGVGVAGVLSASGQLASSDVDHNATAAWSLDKTAGAFGTLALDAKTGAWTYSLNDAAGSPADHLAQGETATETFTATVTDDHGATASQVITVTVVGTNDAPVISSSAAAAQGSVQESGVGVAGVLSASGQLASSDVDHNATAAWSLDKTAGVFGTLALDAKTGAWTYSLNDAAGSPADHLAQGETATETFTATVTDDHGATASQVITVTVVGTNDAPVITSWAAAAQGSVQESGVGVAGVLSASGQLASSDVDHNATAAWSLDKTAGAFGTLALDAKTGAWTYSLDDAAGSPADHLAQGETATETFTATVTDDHGATASQVITVTVVGTNDAPVLSADPVAVHTLTEIAGVTGGPGVQAASATLQFTDVDLSDHHQVQVGDPSLVWSNGAPPAAVVSALSGALTASLSEAAGGGTVTTNFAAPDAAFDFLAAGETLKVTYAVSVTDNHGATSVQPVTLVITGTNDAVTLSVAGTTTAGAITERPGLLGSTLADHVQGAVAFHDPDLSDRPTASLTGQTVSAQLAGGGGFALSAEQIAAFKAALQIGPEPTNGHDGLIDWSYDLQDRQLDFLGAGETVTVVSTVQVDDHHGSVFTKDVVVTLTGSDDAPLVTPDIVGVQKNSSVRIDAAHGVLSNDRDVDLHDLLKVGAVNGAAGNVGHAVTGAYGTLTLDSDGSYGYVANTSPGALPAKGAAQDVFTYTTDDGHGGLTTSQLVVTVYNNGATYVQGSATGGNGSDVMDAGVGVRTLDGGNGADTLIVGWGTSTLTGGSGPDTFVVTHADFGHATITDFHSGQDTLQFDHHIFGNFADVMAHATQQGADLVIAVDANDYITLQNVTRASLSAGDFLFT